MSNAAGFYRRIAVVRSRMELSQRAFAEVCGVSFVTINKWENCLSTPSIFHIEDVAKRLKISPAWLAFGVPYPDESGRILPGRLLLGRKDEKP